MSVAARHMTTRVLVTPVLGTGPYGEVPGAPVALRCWPEQAVKVVRSSDGEDVVSSARLWLLATRRNVAACTIGADVLLDGQASRVVAVAIHHPGAIPTDKLLEVSLA